MSFLSNYSPAGISAVKLMAYSLRSAPTADLVAAGTAFIQGGGTPAQVLNSLFNANIPQSPFTAYGSAYSDGAFVSALIDNLAYGTTISVSTRSAWVASITPLVAQFASRGDAVMALTNMIEASNSTDPDLAMLKAGLLARAETAAAFAQSPAGATYSGQGFAQLLAPMAATLDPTYVLSADASSVNEGGAVTFTLTTAHVAVGTMLAFTLGGTGIAASDITGSAVTGNFTINAAGLGSATITLAADTTTEGPETLRLELPFSGKFIDVSVNDTSVGVPPVPTYALSANLASQDEGASVNYTLTTTNVAAGTVVAFTLSGTGISAADIVGSSLSGNFTVDASGVGTASVALAADFNTEGMESLLLNLAGGAGQIAVSINDTSLTVPPVSSPDLLIIADNMPNGGASIPPTALLGEIGLSTYLSFDLLNQSGATPLRMSLVDLIATNATAGAALNTTNHSADRGNIPQVSNQHLFTHDLGGMTDRVDYSAETGKIVSVIGATASTTQYVLVNDNGTNNVFNDATDRIDTLINVEELVASQGGGVLDLSNSGQDWLISFSKNYSAATDIDATKDRETHRIELSNLNTGVPSGRNYFDFRDAGANAAVTQATAAWTGIQGSDRNETLVFTGAESMDARTNTLRGGTNTVKFNELTRSILVDVTVADWLPSTNLADDSNASGVITATTSFTNGDGVTLLSANTNVSSSHTANNGVSAGLLKIVGSQDAEDALTFSDNAAAKLFVLGQLIGGNDVITAKIGSGAAQNSLELTGFQFLRDNGSSDDVYSIDNMVRAAGGLKLTDSATNDHDAIQIGNDALGSAAVGGVASVVNLATLNGAAPGFNFDFDVLDISLVTGTGLSMVGTAGTDDELVLGTLGSLTAVSLFESLVLTPASLDKGSSLVLDLDTAAVRVGATKLFDYSGSSLSAGGLMFGTAGQTSYVGALAGGMTLAVLDTSAGAGASVMGGNGADTITGGAGNDTIRGGGGNDIVSGGATAESWTFTLGGTADAVAAAANRITVTMTVDGTVLTLTEAALADSTYGDGNGAVLDGASAIGIGDAMIGLINANLTGINGGAGTGTVTGATFNTTSGAVVLSFAPGVNANDAVTFVLNSGTGPDGGSFTLSAGVNVNGNDAGVDTFVFEKSGLLNGSDTLSNFAGASDKLNVMAFTGAAITAAGASVNAVTGGTFAGPASTAQFVYNKAGGLIAVSDFATAAAAGKFVAADGTKFVLAVTADVTGALGDAANTAVSVYFVENGATAGLSDLTVSLVGTISGPAELSLAAIYTALT